MSAPSNRLTPEERAELKRRSEKESNPHLRELLVGLVMAQEAMDAREAAHGGEVVDLRAARVARDEFMVAGKLVAERLEREIDE